MVRVNCGRQVAQSIARMLVNVGVPFAHFIDTGKGPALSHEIAVPEQHRAVLADCLKIAIEAHRAKGD